MKDFTKRVPEFDCIRGTAILFVVLFRHIYMWTYAGVLRKLGTLRTLGLSSMVSTTC
jgi:hypothetical protein